MKNSFFSRFAPQETKFFPVLKNLSELIVLSSTLLVELLNENEKEKRAAFYKEIKDVERKADKLTYVIFDELGKTFITPFDREDIHDLASCMDDVIDGINSSAKRVVIYNPLTIAEAGRELAAFIEKDANLIHFAMDELDKFQKSPVALRDLCIELHNVENHADDVYEHFIKRLFEEEENAVELIKTKEIMQELEKTTDAAERVGKILRNLVVKYA